MKSIALKAGFVGLGMLCTTAAAQEGEGAARAQRDADNPLRMIIEAGKLRPRAKADEPEPAPKPAAKTVPPPQVGTLPDVLVPSLVPLSAGVSATVETVAYVPPAPYDPDNYFGVAPPLLRGAAAAARTASSPAAVAAATAPVGAPAVSPADALPRAPRATLQLVDYVAPAIDDRVRRKLRGDGEVVLDFTVNPDGSVSGVAVRSATDRALEPAALEAVGKWRYLPIAAAQSHGVQLVFKRGE